MAKATRHTFTSRDVIKRQIEQRKFYGKLRGTDHDPAMRVPRTTVSDCRQVAQKWDQLFKAKYKTMQSRSKSWRSVSNRWRGAMERLEATKLGPHETYDDNPGFWKAIHRLASEISSLPMTLNPADVVIWAVKETVKERVEDASRAGKAAVKAAGGLLDALPTIAKVAAVGALGLGVYAVARR